MKSWAFLIAVMMAIVLGLAFPTGVSAEAVGRITQVEGRVDLLKGGKLPATLLKVGDPVGSGDVLRSKSLSKAQITFVDNSVITISPESRLVIEDYQFDPAKQKRNAVIEVFYGLAHVVVNKIFKTEEPDFIVKTQTATTGVRGTDFGVRLTPNSTTILNFQGKTRVASSFPEVGAWLKRTGKIAYTPNPRGSLFPPGSFVDLGNMQGTEVHRGLPPTMPFGITAEDRQHFMNQMSSGILSRRENCNTSGAAVACNLTEITGTNAQNKNTGGVPGAAPLGLVTGTGSSALTLINVVTVPPKVDPSPTPAPTPSTFSFTQQYYSAWIQMADAPFNQASLLAYSWGQRTGVYDGYFYGSTTATRTAAAGSPFSILTTGTSTGTATGTVTGILGQTLTGTMTYTGTNSFGNSISRTGTVSILPTGELTYNWTDSVTGPDSQSRGTGSGTSTQTPGTYFSQTASGNYIATPNLTGNQQTFANSGDLSGSRSMAGITSSFKAGFSLTSTAPDANTFASESGSVSIASQGVLGPADSTGMRTGVMTSAATVASESHTVGGPVTYLPASATAPEAMFGKLIGNPTGRNNTGIGVWAQTPDSGAQILTQTYEGNFSVSPSSSTSGTVSSSGWGFTRTTDEAGNPTVVPKYGTATATVTDSAGVSSIPGVINQTVAAVVNRGVFPGPAMGVGLISPNRVVAIQGSIDSTSTISFSGNYVGPGSQGTVTAGTHTMTPGTYFEQTTNPGTGAMTLSAQQGTGPYIQTMVPSATMTRTGVAPANNLALSPSSIITNTTAAQGAFPATGTVPTVINMQGVAAPEGPVQGGNMTMIIHHPSGSPVTPYVGSVSINNQTNALSANVIGQNPANPGVNRVPAYQTGTIIQQ
ncbi:MAG: FecR domain-containing protein [Thermodesulfobacteriota bacterium]